MLVSDMPNVPPQDVPVMVAQAKQVQANDATVRTLGVCHPSPSNRYTLENITSPVVEAREFYLRQFEHKVITDTATVTILQQPKHGVFRLVAEADRGKLFSDTSAPINPDDPGYAYLPEKGYLGKDSATVLVDFGGIKVKIIYFLQGINGPLGNTGLDIYCWKHGLYWKISANIGVENYLGLNTN